jgi:N-carbamoyl-L-amino-acid hydrolase
MNFAALWADLLAVGRDASTGGYRRFAWTSVDAELREWFAAQAQDRSLDLVEDRAGNQWAWWGDPDADGPGLALGSHLDSVPDGGAFDGPLGVVSAFAALDALRARGFQPNKPIAIVNFADEEGARFGVACAGSRLLTGQLSADRALALTDVDGLTMAEALVAAGRDPATVGADPATVGRVEAFVELHVEQGRGLVDLDRPVALADSIWPHGRWRVDLPGEANHAGTTRLVDRNDPMIAYAQAILLARASASRHRIVATCGKVRVAPNGVNAVPSHVTAWLDARGADPVAVGRLVAEMTELAAVHGGTVTEESWTAATPFDTDLLADLAGPLGAPPVLATGAGHDAGILAQAGVPTAMLFVRNPSGISHSPAEYAEPADCEAGVEALIAVIERRAG